MQTMAFLHQADANNFATTFLNAFVYLCIALFFLQVFKVDFQLHINPEKKVRLAMEWLLQDHPVSCIAKQGFDSGFLKSQTQH